MDFSKFQIPFLGEGDDVIVNEKYSLKDLINIFINFINKLIAGA